MTEENFPLHGGGNVVFQRDIFIKETASLVLEKPSTKTKYESFYWRAPVGSGKTVFLKLLGNELQNRGCDVYLTIAKKLDRYDEDYFAKLAREAGEKTVALLVDDVQNDT
jgi:chromosomal replication initiation ATPase DnaA